MTPLYLWLFLALGGPRSHPACLMGHPSIEKEFAQSVAVVEGRVMASRADSATKEWLDGTTYIVRVERRFRGPLPGRIELFSENSSGRFPMDSGAVYLLFIYRDFGRLAVDNCGNSGLLSTSAPALSVVERLAKQ